MGIENMTFRWAAALGLAGLGLAACSGPTHHAASLRVSPSPSTTTTTTAPTTTTTTVVPSTTTSTTVRTAVIPTTTATTGRVTTTSTTRPACPANLAQSLASTGSARQLITVESTSYDTTVATLELWQQSGGCWTAAGGPWSAHIGENGFSDHHREGDGTTPTGLYSISSQFYGNAPDPGVHGSYHSLVCGDWWDEDPTSAQYNEFVHVACGQQPSFGGGSEALWTETAPYPSFAVIEYNAARVPYAGSGVFLHRDTGGPTIGCVSIPLADLDETLRWLEPGDSPAIVMGPSSEITGF
jgi:L,D-peptidoglycan transpeptidase YkuD (ErfK/YbiS/YcfS/YnhG family)